MYGAIIGDIVGSKFEFDFTMKSKNFPFISEGCSYTDDSIMTVAVARALMKAQEDKSSFKHHLIMQMQEMGKRFPAPQGGYGTRFSEWLTSEHPVAYNSYGNGSAMRVSPCGLIAVELSEALNLAKASAEVTHNHPEGIKGAQAVAAAVFLAKTGDSKEDIKEYIEEHFYPLDKSLDELRPSYSFNESCQGTVPQAITAFLESNDYEDAVRNAVSLGGDSDTIGAITGAIAWAYYKNNPTEPPLYKDRIGYWLTNRMAWYQEVAKSLLPTDFVETIDEFEKRSMNRIGVYHRAGMCSVIPVDKWDTHFYFRPISLERLPLIESIKIRSNELLKAFQNGENFIHILAHNKVGVYNYADFLGSYSKVAFSNEVVKDRALLLEECFIILTIIWRADYASGGGTLEKHKPVIEQCCQQIIRILSMYE